jgi:hypothetical protein
MAHSIWIEVNRVWCQRVGAEAALLEERVFPAEVLPNAEPAYHVRARKCSFGVDCNLAGFTCQYAFNNPNHDPFA